ncbi:MAG TPA: DNA oxidative demethylase AlkB [Polyangiaceae bacterium]|nr:DNA oxidative demethylase AlkB [Polyangiaceae bacterium]
MVQLSLDVGRGLVAPSPLGPGAWLLPGFALPRESELLEAVEAVQLASPFRHLQTPGGQPMSVAMTNTGELGWHSDAKGYRYEPIDPTHGRPWPTMPDCFRKLAQDAAVAGGFANFAPDACLINRYEVGARLTPHRDEDERDFSQPIVSVSLGIPAVFQFGGTSRSGPFRRVRLEHGDVVVWGGPSRLVFHGILPIEPAEHARLGPRRVNLTFRRAG